MAYAVYADMLELFGRLELLQLTDLDPESPLTAPDQGKVGRTLADASEVINGYAAGRYALPLSPVPDPVRRWTCVIARYYLHGSQAPERVRKDYEDAVAALKDVAKGLIILQADGDVTPAGNAAGAAAQSAGPRKTFSVGRYGSLKGF
jgi:phage gp36-like protein